MAVAPLIVAAVGLLSGVVLLWAGWRGRLVGTDPHCRRCGFNLTGLPEATQRCPECGARFVGLKPWDRPAVRVGRRERRGRLLAWGAALSILCGLWLAVGVTSVVAGASFARHKPVWLLAWEAGRDGAAGADAVVELKRRMQAGELPPARVQSLVAAFLADQADLSRPWAPVKGDFLEQAQADGVLAKADWERYVHQAVAPALRVRPTVRFEGPVPVSIRHDDLRLGTAAAAVLGRGRAVTRWGINLWVVAQYPDGSVHALGGDQQESLWESTAPGVLGTITTHDHLQISRPAGSTAGDRPASAPVRYGVWIEQGAAGPLPPAPRRLAGWPAHSVPFAVAPPGEATAVARGHPGMQQLVSQTLRLKMPRPFRARPGWERSAPGTGVLIRRRVSHFDGPSAKALREAPGDLDITFERPADPEWPLAGSWSVWVRVGGREHRVGTLTYPAAPRANMGCSLRHEWPDRSGPTFGGPDRVDVLLRPDAEAAERTVDIATFWDGEVTFEGVRVFDEADLSGRRGGPP